MSGWRHKALYQEHPASLEDDASDKRSGCFCRTPTPDPASPCGYRIDDCVCGRTQREHALPRAHKPTRCTCQHPIERVP